MKRRLALMLALPLVLPCPVGAQDRKTQQAGTRLRQESRVWILRGLQSEFVTIRKPLPRGDKGLPLTSTGQVDENELKRLVTNNGVAVNAGELVQITAIRFEKSEIVFEINGGGRKKRKWFQNIEVGMGGSTRPVNSGQSTELPTGSSIALNFGGPVPDLTVDDLKVMLEPAIDFARRSASTLFVDSLPPEIQEAIKNNTVLVGMDKDMVLAAKGRPQRKMRERRKDGLEIEDWIYGVPPSKVMFITFDGDQVIEVKEFTPGIASAAARAAEGDAAPAPPPATPVTAPAAPAGSAGPAAPPSPRPEK